MKKSFLIYISCLSAILVSKPLKREYVDGVLFVVDKYPVLNSDRMAVEEDIKLKAVIPGLLYPSRGKGELSHQAIQVLINEKLIEGACEEAGLKVEAVEVQERVDAIIKSHPRISNEEGLKQGLRSEGQTLSLFKKRLYKQLLFTKFKYRFIMPQVNITEKDIKEYSLVSSGGAQELETVFIKKIMISCKAGAQACDAEKAKIAAAHTQLREGGSFDELIKLYSSGTGHSVEVEDYDLADLGSAELKRVLKRLGKGQFSEPLLLGGSYYIFQLIKREEKARSPMNNPKLKAELTEKLLGEEMAKWLKERRDSRGIPKDFNKILIKTKG